MKANVYTCALISASPRPKPCPYGKDADCPVISLTVGRQPTGYGKDCPHVRVTKFDPKRHG